MLRTSILTTALALSLAPAICAQTWFVASLDGEQETPPITTSASGWGVIRADPTTSTVSIFAKATISANAAHLHAGAPGVPGGVIVSLSPGAGNTWSAIGAPLSASNFSALMAGNTYINVHTSAFPGGELRGQVVRATTEAYSATLDGSQEVPSSGSSATGEARLYLHTPGNLLTYEVKSSGLFNVTAAHLHQAAAGSNGPVLFSLNGSGGNYCGVSGKLGSSALMALRAGDTYVNIHTSTHLGGEIRGQVLPSGDAAALAAAMDGSQEVPPVTTAAIGQACFTLQPDGTMTYRVTTQGITGTVAHVHRAAAGSNGGVVFSLSGGPTVWQGSTPVLTPAQLADATGGLWYVNVHSAAHPGGEIRGQVAVAQLPNVFSAGCAGTSGDVPEISSGTAPCPGATFTIDVRGGAASAPGSVLFGVTRSLPPLDLTPFGLTDCFLAHNDAGASLGLSTDANGCGSTSFPMPMLVGASGAEFFNTAVMIDFGANPANVIVSNALASRLP